MISPDQTRALRAALAQAGVYAHDERAGWTRLALLLAVITGCLAAVTVLPLWTAALWIPLCALASTTAAMLGHEGCHGSFSSKRWQNQLFATVTFPLLAGLGAMYWKHKHNALHHGHPNVLGADPDVELWPWASCREDYERSGRVRRFFQRYLQRYLFWPSTTLLPLVMRTSSIAFLIRHARRRGVNREWALDAGALVVHYTLWLGGGSLIWGPLGALAVYAAMWSLVGVLLALIFAPAHIGLPLVSGQNNDWVHQLETTRNLRTSPWLAWFFVGLDYQVEHHMFPRIPHQHLPHTRDIVRAWCAENGLPHQEIGYAAALRSVTGCLANAWRTPAPTAAAARAAWQAAPAGVVPGRPESPGPEPRADAVIYAEAS